METLVPQPPLDDRPPVRPAAPRLRADATRNRERILAAARELFVEVGVDVPMDEIARRAGVGNATVYRNFPDRAALAQQVALSVLDRILVRAREAQFEPDAFAALCRFVHAAADERVGALCTLLSEHVALHADDELFAVKTLLDGAVQSLMDRAQQAGTMRTDVAPGDVFVALARLTRPLPGSQCLAHDESMFVHRHLALFLDGLRAAGCSELPGRPITLEELRRP
ncbi:TetR family transcriptional regulator [Streptomyces tateyamensis]|uniref:TetR family transcriptional regulator n=1 Tax=Streptomyces tateyamensis TaxID=565073 RepID=A0A2V4NW28_9ACTN|nr:TetR/AcrR family transcriptional regulator [Streptomyces tateyamensis]PYC80837.1 TetR family transcriptional regulator [Streptomyces tateyamensis]